MNSTSSRAAVRSMATLTHAARATPAARSVLSPFATRSLSSNTRQFVQFPRLQSLNTFSNKRSFGTTVRMVCCLEGAVDKQTN